MGTSGGACWLGYVDLNHDSHGTRIRRPANRNDSPTRRKLFSKTTPLHQQKEALQKKKFSDNIFICYFTSLDDGLKVVDEGIGGSAQGAYGATSGMLIWQVT